MTSSGGDGLGAWASAPKEGDAAISSTAATTKALFAIGSPTNSSSLDCPQVREFSGASESGPPRRIVSDSDGQSLAGLAGNVTQGGGSAARPAGTPGSASR